MIRVTNNAVERYCERVGAASREDALAALTSRAVECAVKFGAMYVRLSGGQRIVIHEGIVVTVLPAQRYRRQVQRVGLGRYGHGHHRFLEGE